MLHIVFQKEYYIYYINPKCIFEHVMTGQKHDVNPIINTV